MTDPFRIATRDELWSRGRLLESRISHGEAIHDDHGIVAIDASDRALLEACGRELERLREAMPDDGRVRLVATASSEEVFATMTITRGALSVVSSPEHAQRDDELLRSIGAIEPEGSPVDYRGIPIVWRNGSGSVLLHEAIGHAAEHDHEPIEWPEWLEVSMPLRMRRATFRDVPLRRMTTLIARQNNAPFELPPRRIEVLLVGGGAYEPLDQRVTIHVAAADLVDGNVIRRLPPFEIHETRSAVARAIAGAEGDPIRYPGVVCSREGQELVVGSFAPLMVTRFR